MKIKQLSFLRSVVDYSSSLSTVSTLYTPSWVPYLNVLIPNCQRTTLTSRYLNNQPPRPPHCIMTDESVFLSSRSLTSAQFSAPGLRHQNPTSFSSNTGSFSLPESTQGPSRTDSKLPPPNYNPVICYQLQQASIEFSIQLGSICSAIGLNSPTSRGW